MAQPGSFVMFYDRLIKDFDEKAKDVFGRRGAPKRFRHIRQTWVNQKRRYEIEEKLLKDGLELPANEGKLLKIFIVLSLNRFNH